MSDWDENTSPWAFLPSRDPNIEGATVTLTRKKDVAQLTPGQIEEQTNNFRRFLNGELPSFSIAGITSLDTQPLPLTTRVIPHLVPSDQNTEREINDDVHPAKRMRFGPGPDSVADGPTSAAEDNGSEVPALTQPEATVREDLEQPQAEDAALLQDMSGQRDEVQTEDTENDNEAEQPDTHGDDNADAQQAGSPKVQQGWRLECRICSENMDVDTSVFLNCGHCFCHGCLDQCFQTGLSSKASFPPRCCTADGIDISTVFPFLSDENIDRWTKVAEEYATRNAIFCANKECSEFFNERRLGKLTGKFIDCNMCLVETCIECKQIKAGHAGENADECPELISKEDKELADGEKWKQCPGCKNLVEKDEGCDHMTCECGTEFCYECGEEKEEDNSCGCQTFPDEDGWHQRLDDEELEANEGLDEEDRDEIDQVVNHGESAVDDDRNVRVSDEERNGAALDDIIESAPPALDNDVIIVPVVVNEPEAQAEDEDGWIDDALGFEFPDEDGRTEVIESTTGDNTAVTFPHDTGVVRAHGNFQGVGRGGGRGRGRDGGTVVTTLM